MVLRIIKIIYSSTHPFPSKVDSVIAKSMDGIVSIRFIRVKRAFIERSYHLAFQGVHIATRTLIKLLIKVY